MLWNAPIQRRPGQYEAHFDEIHPRATVEIDPLDYRDLHKQDNDKDKKIDKTFQYKLFSTTGKDDDYIHIKDIYTLINVSYTQLTMLTASKCIHGTFLCEIEGQQKDTRIHKSEFNRNLNHSLIY